MFYNIEKNCIKHIEKKGSTIQWNHFQYKTDNNLIEFAPINIDSMTSHYVGQKGVTNETI